MNKNKKILIGIIIGILLIAIIILSYLLLKPINKDKYSLIDKIDVDSNLIDVEEINTSQRDVQVKDRNEMYQILKEEAARQNPGDVGFESAVEEYDDEGNVLDDESLKTYADSTRIETIPTDSQEIFRNLAATEEKLAKYEESGLTKYFETNYYKEDALAIIKKELDPSADIVVELNRTTPKIIDYNGYGDISVMWLFNVTDKTTGEEDSKLAVDVNSGIISAYDIYGGAYPFRNYKYNKNYEGDTLIDEEYKMLSEGEVVVRNTVSKETIWKKIDSILDNKEEYESGELRVDMINGKEYYKFETKNGSKVLYFDYITGEQVNF